MYRNAGLVQLLNDGLGWDTNGGDEEFGTGIDDDIDEII